MTSSQIAPSEMSSGAIIKRHPDAERRRAPRIAHRCIGLFRNSLLAAGLRVGDQSDVNSGHLI